MSSPDEPPEYAHFSDATLVLLARCRADLAESAARVAELRAAIRASWRLIGPDGSRPSDGGRTTEPTAPGP